MWGKVKKKKCLLMKTEDHPRTCGEKSFNASVFQQSLGSPPHMRGKATSSRKTPESVRITPAHAGKRRQFQPPKPSPVDHPRTCGEKTTGESAIVAEDGSPPHMRGKGLLSVFSVGEKGIQCQQLKRYWHLPRIKNQTRFQRK